MDKLYALLFLAILPASFALDVEYNVTKRENFPYQVSLRLDGIHKCGGTIYSKKHILTAATCVNGTKPTQWEVVTGFLNLQKPPTNTTQSFKVDKFYIHPNYTSKFPQNNIAILKLSKELKSDNFTGSIPIARKWSDVEARSCIVSGWGANGTYATKHNDLYAANLTMGSQMQCSYYKQFLPKVMACAGSSGMQNPCTGDLGGPLTCNGTLYGIVGWRGQCLSINQPGMYTNVTYFADWISKEAKTNGAGMTTSALLLSFAAVTLNLLRSASN